MEKLGALNLVKTYEDNSEDDINDNAEKVPELDNAKKVPELDNAKKVPELDNKDKLPLPDSVKKLYENDTDYFAFEDDPISHNGRLRSFPHQRGNWATFLYIPYHCRRMNDAVTFCEKTVNKYFEMDCFIPCKDLHISLSRTFILLHHWIDLFVESINEHFINIKRFYISFGSFEVYCNEEKTRTFIGLRVSHGYNEIMNCVHNINKCLSEFNLQEFYQDASFHVSLAWCLGDKTEEVQKILPNIQSSLINFVKHLNINDISIKTGNRHYRIGLSG